LKIFLLVSDLISTDNEIITEPRRDAMLRVFSPVGIQSNNLSY